MSYAPASIEAARTYLKSKGVPANGLGIVGDTAHGNEGYHCGWDRLSRGYGTGDYSYGESPRDRIKSDAAMALDIGGMPEQWIEDFNVWLVGQCAQGAPDTLDIREVIYRTRDDKVKRWDRLNRRSSGDLSHLWHTHISYFRDSESRDKTALFRRFFEGQVVAALSTTIENFLYTWSQGVPTFNDDKGNKLVNCPVQWEISRGKREAALAAAVGRVEATLNDVKAAVSKPAAVTASVDASAVATALAGNPAFLAAIAKAVNDDAASRMKS